MSDLVGTDFPDLEAARFEAVRIAGEWLRDNADTVAEHRAPRFDVSDESRKILISILRTDRFQLKSATHGQPRKQRAQP